MDAADCAGQPISVDKASAESSQDIPTQGSLELLEVPEDDPPAVAVLFDFDGRSRWPIDTAFLELFAAPTGTGIVSADIVIHAFNLAAGCRPVTGADLAIAVSKMSPKLCMTAG
jgi:hypothetical protein